MSDNSIVLIIQAVIGLLIVLMFPPGRRLLWGLAVAGGKLLGQLIQMALAWGQAAMVHIFQAHMVVMRNLRPRVTVLPTVARKSTRRE